MNIYSLIFDLDGTLWDTTALCASAWNKVNEQHHFGLRHFSPEDVAAVAGKTAAEIEKLLYPKLSAEEKQKFTELIQREEVSEISGHQHTALYPGVREMLFDLRKTYSLHVVSNCPHDYLQLFLEGSGLAECFDDFESHGRTALPKSENIRSVVQRNGLLSAVYIGDTSGDEAAAMAANVPFFHAAYGYGEVGDCVKAFSTIEEAHRYFSL